MKKNETGDHKNETVTKEPELLQLKYKEDPWKLLVCCALLNRTSRRQVDGVVEMLFEQYPNAEQFAHARVDDLRELLHPLGFSNQRSKRLLELSRGWVKLTNTPPPTGAENGREAFLESLLALPGVGEYAIDSYRIFVLDDWHNVRPRDKKLRRWLHWRRALA